MSVQLEMTGERVIEESYSQSLFGQVVHLMHLASYDFAIPYCMGKKVLDLGCGSGYGASRIADVAVSVYAVDVSPEAVAYAQEQYARGNACYSVIEPNAVLPFGDREFDVVLSFQVIEHVQDDAAYLAEAARVLSDDGVLIVITPDRKCRLLPGQQPWNRWHLREYSADSLRSLVAEYFDVEDLLRMEADTPLANVEMKRYRILKWATLPVTLPGTPEAIRQWGLGLFHRLRYRRTAAAPLPPDPSLSVHSIRFVAHTKQPLNLLVLSRPKRRAAPKGER